MCYVHAGNGFRAALYTNPDSLLAPSLWFGHFMHTVKRITHRELRSMILSLALGHVAEARQTLADRESADMLGALALAGSAITTFYERSSEASPVSGHKGNFAEAISAARWRKAPWDIEVFSIG